MSIRGGRFCRIGIDNDTHDPVASITQEEAAAEVDVHVMSVRRKLGGCGDWIETVRGFGYKFSEEEW